MNSAFSEVWSTFCAELDSRNRRLQEEFAECWGQIHPLLEGLARDFNLEHWQQPERGRLPSLDMLVETAGKVLLFDPIRVLKKAHPLQRALGAIEAYDSAMEDLLRVLPQQGMVSGRELSEVMRERGIRSWRHAWLRWRREPQPRRLRLAARRRILQDALEQSRYQGQVMLVMAKASLALLVPWQLVRQETLRTLHGAEPELQALEKERRVWLGLIQSLQARASAVFPRYEARASRASARVSASLLRMQAEHSDKGEALMRDRRQKCFGFWSRQQRAVGSLLELELTMARLLTEAGRTSRESLRSLHEEHAQLRKEMDDVISWLEAQRSAVADTPFPPPEARLSSAEDRTGEWLRSLSARAKASLPAHVESIIPRRALPGRKPPGRQLEPEGLFTGVLERTGRRRAAAGFREAEAGHRAVVREIERAREVAAFSLEAAAEGDQEGLQVARDGIANALELVKHQRQGTRDYQQITEQGLAEGLAAGFYEFHLALEEGRIGFLAHLARQRGSQLLLTGSKLAMSRTRAAAGQSQKLITRGYNRLLVQAGWSPPSVTAAEPVTRREYLGELLRLQAVPRVLPPIYRRLFRLAPVEDARFLVGREAEMSALTEARGHWESGRSVSVVIVGARGSGKTSLLKCASSSVFADLEVLYGQFCERLTTEEGIVGFLADLLQTGPDKLGETFSSGRRVILLEELERTFLRRIGGFEGLRVLREWIARTSLNTMWILSLNETAFRFLDAVTGLGSQFSHRINAMAVAPEYLHHAVLQRHNLSGLRLQFAPPPDPKGRLARARLFFGVTRSPEQSFFDSLYRQSDGVFRAAFELWQQSIDRVEGGVLYMLDPLQPDYDPIIATLTLQDAFSLQAILQHGSLTPEEIAQILDLRVEASRAQMDRLGAWELVEQDPRCPGLRVCPEAGRMVHIALHRQNLL